MVKVAVHRGGGSGPLQNTSRGIRKAVEADADVIEVDVHFSSDGIPFLYHDRWINGMNVYDYTANQLLRMGLNTLEEVLNEFDTTFYLDLKDEPNEILLKIVDDSDVILGSFNGLVIKELVDIGFTTSLILSTVVPPETIDRLVDSVNADYVNLGWEHHLPKNYVEILKNIRTPVISWTENNEKTFQNLIGLADIVMTDRLDLVSKYKQLKHGEPKL